MKTSSKKRRKPKALPPPLSEDEIEDIVLNSPPFIKELKSVEKEARKKGWRSLADVRSVLKCDL